MPTGESRPPGPGLWLLARLDRLLALEALSADAVGRALGTELRPRDSPNPYFRLFEAELDGGAARAEYREPGTGATGRTRILTLALQADEALADTDVTARFGPGEIAQVMPGAQPEGLLSLRYAVSPRFALHCQLTARTRRVVSMTLSQEG